MAGRGHPASPADAFAGYTIRESTGVLAGDALLTAWNYWGELLQRTLRDSGGAA